MRSSRCSPRARSRATRGTARARWPGPRSASTGRSRPTVPSSCGSAVRSRARRRTASGSDVATSPPAGASPPRAPAPRKSCPRAPRAIRWSGREEVPVRRSSRACAVAAVVLLATSSLSGCGGGSGGGGAFATISFDVLVSSPHSLMQVDFDFVDVSLIPDRIQGVDVAPGESVTFDFDQTETQALFDVTLTWSDSSTTSINLLPIALLGGGDYTYPVSH